MAEYRIIMKNRILLWSLTVPILWLFLACTETKTPDKPEESSGLKGPYLGQEAPGFLPEIFAQGVVSTLDHNERDVTFSPVLDELYFTRDGTIMVMKNRGEFWTEPDTASFSGEYMDFEPFIDPANERLYYISKRPLAGEGPPEDWQIWFVERTIYGWSQPERFADQGDFYPTITNDGVMYFTSLDNDIYSTRLIDGRMGERVKLSDSVNTEMAEYNACIAPDESYLILTSYGWGPGFGGGDLFISYRKEDGSWKQARNMGGGINSDAHEYCPAISPDGSYLFFTSNRAGSEDIYWVDAEIIDYLRTNDLNLADQLFRAVVETGVSGAVELLHKMKFKYKEFCVFDEHLLNGIGDRLLKSGDVKKALEVFRKSLELYPHQSYLQKIKIAALEQDMNEFGRLTADLLETDSLRNLATERGLNLLGYNLLHNQLIDAALKIFALNIEAFPGSWNVYDSYAEALMKKGEYAAAIEYYQKSLEINPENTNAKKMIEKIHSKR